MAYAVVDDVAEYLGVTFSTPQSEQAQLAIDAASAIVDSRTGRSWGVASPATEKHTISGEFLYVDNKPIIAVSSLSVRAPEVDADDVALTANVQYEVLDANKGLILIGNYGDFLQVTEDGYLGYIATVVYSHASSVPANIKLATIIIAAAYMSRLLTPGTQYFASLTDPAGVRVVFKDTKIPDEVGDLLRVRPRATIV